MSEPRTEAGRGQHKTAHKGACPAEYGEECWKLADILAIEREAAAPQPLDVEGLEDAIHDAYTAHDNHRAACQHHKGTCQNERPHPRDLARLLAARLSRKEPSDE